MRISDIDNDSNSTPVRSKADEAMERYRLSKSRRNRVNSLAVMLLGFAGAGLLGTSFTLLLVFRNIVWWDLLYYSVVSLIVGTAGLIGWWRSEDTLNSVDLLP